MFKMIKAEFLKLFRRKSFLIVLIISLVFIILNNFMYKSSINSNSNISNNEMLQLLNDYKNKYNLNWQEYVIDHIICDDIYSASDSLEEYLVHLDEEDWKYFVYLERHKILENQDSVINNIKLKWNDYRLDNNINYDGSSSDIAIKKNIEANIGLLNTNNELEKQEFEKEDAISQYVILNNIDYYNNYSLNGILRVFDDYQIIMILIIIVASSIVISDEISQGTIKWVLLSQHGRKKILSAKIITILGIIIFSVIFVFLAQYIIGNIIFGYQSIFDSTGLVYNYNVKNVICYSVLKCLLINLLPYLPFLLFISFFSILINIIFCNTSLSVIIPFILIFVSDIINNLATTFKIKFLRYFITLNWDLTEVLYGRLPLYPYISYRQCIVIIGIYSTGSLILSYYLFQRKHLKV